MVTTPKFKSDSDEKWFRVYCGELLTQADYGVFAFDERITRGPARDTHWLFPAIHLMLTAAGNVHKIFHPVPKPKDKAHKKRALDRAAWLRPIFDPFPDSTIIGTAKELRDDLEHFDERIDEARSQFGTPDDAKWINGWISPGDFEGRTMQVRHLNSITHVATMCDKPIQLRVLRDEFDQLRQLCQTLIVRIQRDAKGQHIFGEG
jgi:hypothetical protein